MSFPLPARALPPPLTWLSRLAALRRSTRASRRDLITSSASCRASLASTTPGSSCSECSRPEAAEGKSQARRDGINGRYRLSGWNGVQEEEWSGPSTHDHGDALTAEILGRRRRRHVPLSSIFPSNVSLFRHPLPYPLSTSSSSGGCSVAVQSFCGKSCSIPFRFGFVVRFVGFSPAEHVYLVVPRAADEGKAFVRLEFEGPPCPLAVPATWEFPAAHSQCARRAEPGYTLLPCHFEGARSLRVEDPRRWREELGVKREQGVRGASGRPTWPH